MGEQRTLKIVSFSWENSIKWPKTRDFCTFFIFGLKRKDALLVGRFVFHVVLGRPRASVDSIGHYASNQLDGTLLANTKGSLLRDRTTSFEDDRCFAVAWLTEVTARSTQASTLRRTDADTAYQLVNLTFLRGDINISRRRRRRRNLHSARSACSTIGTKTNEMRDGHPVVDHWVNKSRGALLLVSEAIGSNCPRVSTLW